MLFDVSVFVKAYGRAPEGGYTVGAYQKTQLATETPSVYKVGDSQDLDVAVMAADEHTVNVEDGEDTWIGFVVDSYDCIVHEGEPLHLSVLTG